MTVGCYVSQPEKAGAPIFLMFADLPRIGESLILPEEDRDFRVVSICHLAQPASARTRPAVYLELAAIELEMASS